MRLKDLFRSKQEDNGVSIVNYAKQDKYSWGKAKEALDYYSKNEWVFSAITHISSATSKTNLGLYERQKKGGEEVIERITASPILNIINNPMPNKTRKHFITELVQSLLLSGEANYRVVGNEIIFIPTHLITIKSDTLGQIHNISINNDGQKVEIPLDEWFSIIIPDPANLPRGVSPLKAAALAIETDIEAQNFQWNFFKNGALLSGIFKTDQVITEDDQARLEASWDSKFSGSGKSGKTAFLGKGATYQPISESPSTFSVEMSAQLMERILSVFGVPKAIIGIVTDVNRSNAESMDYVYSKYVVEPILENIADAFTFKLLPKIGGSDTMFFKFDDVTPENRQDKNDYLEVAKMFMTVNEMRELEGLGPIEGGDVLVANAQEVVSDDNKDDKEDEKKNIKSVEKEFTEEQTDKFYRSFLKQHGSNEEDIKRKMALFFDEQGKRAVNSIESKSKAVNKNPLDKEKEAELLATFMAKSFVDVMDSEAQRQIAEIPFLTSFDLQNSKVQAFARVATAKFAAEVTDTTVKELKELIANGLDQGDSPRQIAGSISSKFDDWQGNRSLVIARTETTKFSNGASQLLYTQNGVTHKTWITTVDGRERAAHRKANGQTVKIDDKFLVGGERLEAPAVGGSADNVVQCRCAMLPFIK